MRYLVVLLLVPFFLNSQNSAPSDYITKSIKVENTSVNYLSLGANTSTNIEQSGWDIALYNHSHEIGGKINESKGVKVWRVYRDTTNFSSLSLADTIFQIKNNDSFTYLGAMDTIYTGSAQTYFKIGIGKFYLDAGYSVVPTINYIIKKEDGSYGKFYVSYINRIFTIHYANIDNTGDKYYSITKIDPLVKQYQYLSFVSGTLSSAYEPALADFDLILRKYSKGSTEYPLGVLTNNSYNLIRFSNISGFPVDYLKYGVVSTECYEATGDPLTVTYNGSLSTMEPISRLNNQIAEKWFNTTTQLPIQNKSYFLRDKNGRLWHIIFTNYNASTNTVDIAFKDKGIVASLASNSTEADILNVYQNDDKIWVELNQKSDIKSTYLEVLDMTGRRVFNANLKDKLAMDVAPFRNQILLFHLNSEKEFKTIKYLVR